jgi:hypothetical protein
MKIAVTYENGQIFQHFGRTEQFKIYTVEDGAVVSSEVIGNDGFGHGALAGYLAETGVSQQDFLRMKRSALGRRIRDLDSFDATCFRLCAYHFSGFDYFRFPEVYAAVEADEISSFLKQVVTSEGCALSIVYPSESSSN